MNHLFVAARVEEDKRTQVARALVENVEPAGEEIHEQLVVAVPGNRSYLGPKRIRIMGKGVSRGIKPIQATTIGTEPHHTPIVLIEAQHGFIAHAIAVPGRHIAIGAHEYLLDTEQSAPYGTRPHVAVAVTVEAEDRTERKRVDIARHIPDIGEGIVGTIQNADTTAIGGQPQLVIILLDVENHIVGQGRVGYIVVSAYPTSRAISVYSFSVRRNPQVALAVDLHCHNLLLPAEVGTVNHTGLPIKQPQPVPPGRKHPIALVPAGHAVEECPRRFFPPQRHRVECGTFVVPPVDGTPATQVETVVGQHIGVSLQNLVVPIDGLKVIILAPIDTHAPVGRNPDAVLRIFHDKVYEIAR